MQTTTPCPKTSPSLLLIEPKDMGRSERAAQLERSTFSFSQSSSTLELYNLRSSSHFSVVMLSDLIGYSALRASARIVRVQWPKARILILGMAPSQLDDSLYDEALLHTSSEAAMLSMIEVALAHSLNQRTDTFASWLYHASHDPLIGHSRAIQESDPTKISATERTASWKRDLPASDRLRPAAR